LQVPVSALFRDKNRWAVFLIKNGRARKQIIKLGRRNTNMAVVLKGLKSGDKVINYPSDEINDGIRVNYFND
jgi:HlyD family secretion protein